MSFATPPATEPSRIERLLAALEGVVSARVVSDEGGRVVEIHILSSHELQPKQIVRNVESALSAYLGLVVDRRIISVAQMRPDALPITSGSLEVPGGVSLGPRMPSRHVLVGFDTNCSAPLDANCTVTLQIDQQSIQGSGSGANTPQGRAEAAARALFDALTVADDQLRIGLEGVSIVENNGRSFVLVAGHAISGRTVTPVTGVAPLTRSPEEAAILAGLQATNRYTSQPL
ncbi:MAG: hypothetical protein WEE89_02650 [Gemmatimonadota bacterium]